MQLTQARTFTLNTRRKRLAQSMRELPSVLVVRAGAALTHTLYLDIALAIGASLTLEASPLELGVYSVDLDLQIDGEAVATHTLAVLQPNEVTKISARNGARVVVVGGQALDGQRQIWWNFVSTRLERINEAKLAWAEQAMGGAPGETEWIPLPGR